MEEKQQKPQVNIDLNLMFHHRELLKIVYDISPEVKELFKLEEETNQNFYEHPLAKYGMGWISIDLNSDIAKALIKYQKTGKASKKLKIYILNDIQTLMNRKENSTLLPKEERRGFIYILKSNGLYKIGRAKNVKERIKGYQTQNPFGIKVILKKEIDDYIAKEKYLLKSFKDFQVKGEWLKLPKRELQEIIDYLNSQ